jgi:predicted RNA-binding protein with TRAM domain
MEVGEERRAFKAPIEVGKTYNVKIEEVGREGDGITRIERFVVFVPNTKKGDSVKIQVNKVSRRVGFADVVAE